MEGFRTPLPMDPLRRTCGYCRTELDSRNRLFKHLKSCEDAKLGNIRLPPAPRVEQAIQLDSALYVADARLDTAHKDEPL